MSIGKISEFNVGTDNWRLYVERMEQYFIVNNIKGELQVPTLVTVMGSASYELLVNLCTPDKPTTKSFNELATILEKHLQPRPSILAERFKFHHRKQKEGEKVSDYVAELKKMSKTCEFGHWLNEGLRDQLVCGLASEMIRQRLFAEDKLDFQKACSLALNMEAAEKDAALVETQAGGKGVTADCQTMVKVPRGAGAMTSHGRGMWRGASTAGTAVAGARDAATSRRAWTGSAPEGKSGLRVECRVCGGNHDASTCKFKRYVCRICNREGHLRRMCSRLNNGSYNRNQNYNYVEEVAELSSCSSDEVTTINQLSLDACPPILISVNIDNKVLEMECDTGSAVSCISHDMYEKYFKHINLSECKLWLRYYTGETIRPVGVIRPLVRYKDKEKYLSLYVINNGKTMLLGRQWLAELGIQLPDISHNVNNVSDDCFNFDKFSSRYCEVFADGLGRFTGGRVSIHLRPGARPVYMRARPLAYALREPVGRALEQLVRDGVLTPVDRSDWATPIVPVVKKDGNIRICADYKITLNKVLDVDRYPLPRVEDLLARLHGGERFTKIDLSQAYAQLVLDDTREYTVINTHKGMFRYNRLVYGLASSPGIFQKILEQLFAHLPYVGVFLDDIIITGANASSHLDNLNKVFDILQKNGLKVRKEKCTFFAESVTYLGYVISKNGVHTCADKVKAIAETPIPENVPELRAFLGMVMYYAKFIENMSTIAAPLYYLLRTGVTFAWSGECQTAFDKIKHLLSSSKVLVHYSTELPLIMTADASSVGVGAVISHITDQGERPIAYASRALSKAERAYSQIEREALAIIYGVRKFHQYLYGRKFTLRTDHKPLTSIFGSKVGIPVMAASRMQRWGVLLSGYNYDIEFVSSAKNNADALSRLPSGKCHGETTEVTYINFVEKFLPISHRDVRKATAADALLSRILLYTQSGWPASCCDDEVKSYFCRRHELYSEANCVMWGYRIVIPLPLRPLILKQLHNSHMGIVKTKATARSYVWWPNIDADIEDMCRRCETCALEMPAPPRAQPQHWPYINQPWSRLHIDFLGPFHGSTFLVVIDATSKWIEVFEMSRTTATAVIKILRSLFARFGLPLEVVSDQGPPFTSSEFAEFLKNNGIRQAFSPAYHPASNGAAENAVKLCKRAIKKAITDNIDVDAALQTFLLAYRNSIHSTTGETPASILQRRPLRTRLDLLRNDRAVLSRVSEAQSKQAEYAGGKLRQFEPGEQVWFRNYRSRDKWEKGSVVHETGSRRLQIREDNGRQTTKHVDQIRRRSRMSDVACPGEVGVEPVRIRDHLTEGESDNDNSIKIDTLPKVATPERAKTEYVGGEHDDDVFSTPTPHSPQPGLRQKPCLEPPVNRSKRLRKPVSRLQLD